VQIVAADVGATKTRVALVDTIAPGLPIVAAERFENAHAGGLEALVVEYTTRHRVRPDGVAIAVAAPVAGRRARMTNLSWHIDADEIAARLGCARVCLLNDFHAVALGIAHLSDGGRVCIQAGVRIAGGVTAVLGAGTGLGEAMVVASPSGPIVVPSEGGHADFAPTDELQIDLLRFALRRHDHVSYERVCSGIGWPLLYEFLRSRDPDSESRDVRDALARGDDAGATIGTYGVDRLDVLCGRTLDLFVDIYGAEAGNLALKALPRGGLFVAGGIAPRILGRMTDGRFLRAFRAKGRYEALLASIPVDVVTDPDVALRGAASCLLG